MVKVLGKDNTHIHQVTCKNCASILEYTLSEVKHYMKYDYGGDADIYYYIECPSCFDGVYTKNH